MIQVELSIQAGRVMPSMLLRKLGSYSRKTSFIEPSANSDG
jgi:hypothetical protein